MYACILLLEKKPAQREKLKLPEREGKQKAFWRRKERRDQSTGEEVSTGKEGYFFL